MRRETILTLRITWDTDEVERPGAWDWSTLVDAERGHVEIFADSDWQCRNRAFEEFEKEV
jgi:hypothetical protein